MTHGCRRVGEPKPHTQHIKISSKGRRRVWAFERKGSYTHKQKEQNRQEKIRLATRLSSASLASLGVGNSYVKSVHTASDPVLSESGHTRGTLKTENSGVSAKER